MHREQPSAMNVPTSRSRRVSRFVQSEAHPASQSTASYGQKVISLCTSGFIRGFFYYHYRTDAGIERYSAHPRKAPQTWTRARMTKTVFTPPPPRVMINLKHKRPSGNPPPFRTPSNIIVLILPLPQLPKSPISNAKPRSSKTSEKKWLPPTSQPQSSTKFSAPTSHDYDLWRTCGSHVNRQKRLITLL